MSSTIRVLDYPFRWSTWRPTVALIVHPVTAIVGGVLTLRGRNDRAGRVLQWPSAGETTPPHAASRQPCTDSILLRIFPGLIVAVLMLYLFAMLPVNVLYPLRPDVSHDSLRHSWGGPSLLGAWAVHALLVVPLLWILPFIGRLIAITGQRVHRELHRHIR
jgi:hypothetical protein